MCYLAIYDLSGIQRFIFFTNKMKEIIGASSAVHDILFCGLPETLGVDPTGWKKGQVTFNNSDTRKIVYVGGGNALVLYSDEDSFDYYTNLLNQYAYSVSGGAIRLYSACIVLDETKSLGENQKVLMAILDEKKKSGGTTSSMPALPIVAVDNSNYEPLVLVEGNKYTTSARYAKLKSKSKETFDHLKPYPNVEFADSILPDDDNTKNYQAIIHIDGNTMGIKIREYVNKLSGNIWDQMTKMRDLSVSISNLYNDTLKLTLSELYPEQDYQRTTIPFRPVVADGDDVTVMLEAAKSFDFVERFIHNLEHQKISAFGDSFVPTAAAGIAFVKVKFPFATAYDLAEACCKNAKSKTIKRMGGSVNFLSHPVSSIDYQICYNNISDDLSEFRADNYQIDDNSLIKRPYVFVDADDYSFKDFKALCKECSNAKDGEGKVLANSKLKGLRNAYGVSANEARSYCRYVLAHTNTKEEQDMAYKYFVPFNEKHEATLFDYLDIMDIVWKED